MNLLLTKSGNARWDEKNFRCLKLISNESTVNHPHCVSCHRPLRDSFFSGKNQHRGCFAISPVPEPPGSVSPTAPCVQEFTVTREHKVCSPLVSRKGNQEYVLTGTRNVLFALPTSTQTALSTSKLTTSEVLWSDDGLESVKILVGRLDNSGWTRMPAASSGARGSRGRHLLLTHLTLGFGLGGRAACSSVCLTDEQADT